MPSPVSSKISTPPLTQVTDTLPKAEEDGQTASEPADELPPSPEVPQGFSDPPRPEDTPAPPILFPTSTIHRFLHQRHTRIMDTSGIP